QSGVQDVECVCLEGCDFRLAKISPYRRRGTDGADLGADVFAIERAAAGLVVSRVVSLEVAGAPYRLKITGSTFLPGVRVYIGDDEAPWPTIRLKSSRTIV